MADSDSEVQFGPVSCNDMPMEQGTDEECEDNHALLEDVQMEPGREPTNDESNTDEPKRRVNIGEENNDDVELVEDIRQVRRHGVRQMSPSYYDRRRSQPRDRHRESTYQSDDDHHRGGSTGRRRRRTSGRRDSHDDSDDSYEGNERYWRPSGPYGGRGDRRKVVTQDSDRTGQGDFLRNSMNVKRSNIPLIRPESFDGTSDWESYFSHFTNCADLGRWSDEEKALTLASCLQGPARTFYLGLTDQERRIFRTLVHKLYDRFGSKRQQTKYVAKLETRKREPGETLASFGDDLRVIAKRAYPDLDNNAQESLGLHQFYKAISPEMKCRCLDRDCRTIQQAVDVVERYELVLGPDDKKRGNVRMVTNASAYQPSDSMAGNTGVEPTLVKQMHDIMTRLDQIEARLNKQGNKKWNGNNQKQKNNFTGCFVCKSMEHYAKDCPQKPTAQKNLESENSRPLA